jgi:hypothetical protein
VSSPSQRILSLDCIVRRDKAFESADFVDVVASEDWVSGAGGDVDGVASGGS